ncbi:MAG: S24/S26 family peptidase [Candidatus Omnitrophota bacterium]
MRYSKVVKEIYLNTLEEGRPVTLPSSGWCMWPFIKGGDILTLRSGCGRIEIGDIAIADTCSPDEVRFAGHRVIGIETVGDKKIYFLKSDNSAGKSSESIPEDKIRGRIVSVTRNGLVFDYSMPHLKMVNRAIAFMSARAPLLCIFLKMPVYLIIKWRLMIKDMSKRPIP